MQANSNSLESNLFSLVSTFSNLYSINLFTCKWYTKEFLYQNLINIYFRNFGNKYVKNKPDYGTVNQKTWLLGYSTTVWLQADDTMSCSSLW